MTKIRIVTDSTGDIPKELLQELGIGIVSLKVHFGEETYLDAKDLTPKQFYQKLAASKDLPTTSQPSPADFMEVYKKILEEDPETIIISIHLSSALSGTYQSALVAKSMMEDSADITVFDSKSASYGIGNLAVQAAKAVNEGKSKDEVLQIIETLRDQSRLYFYVDTLEYLQKGGRIGKAAALLGSLLQIKPILSIDAEGEVHAVDKVRGSKKAAAKIVQLLKDNYGEQPVETAIAHCNEPEDAEMWRERIGQEFNVVQNSVTEIGSVIGTHAGPGAVGIFMFPVLQDGSV